MNGRSDLGIGSQLFKRKSVKTIMQMFIVLGSRFNVQSRKAQSESRQAETLRRGLYF
jgi:CelD/BcsL family acetyltransferase involved in cellulose biosynthesis